MTIKVTIKNTDEKEERTIAVLIGEGFTILSGGESIDSYVYSGQGILIKDASDMGDKMEWRCPECEQEGLYLEIRGAIERGVDVCPDCRCEVENIE